MTANHTKRYNGFLSQNFNEEKEASLSARQGHSIPLRMLRMAKFS